jgi:hypothetical protein
MMWNLVKAEVKERASANSSSAMLQSLVLELGLPLKNFADAFPTCITDLLCGSFTYSSLRNLQERLP